MSLKEKLDELARKSASKFPDNASKILQSFRMDLKGSGIEEGIPREGDILPDFDLEDQDHNRVLSMNLLTEGPLVVVFFRGKW